MLTFDYILQQAVELNPRINVKRLKDAYEYAEKLHAGEYRMSGDPYVDHLLSVANYLLSLTSDEDTLIAAFLHSIANREDFDDEKFKERFGEDVYFLVNSLGDLDRVRSRDDTAEAEVIRRMFLTIAKDLRVILIKMADRLHNMETLSFRSEAKQKQIAKETMDIYVPISARLGIYRLKGRLEDRCFKHLYGHQYEHLKVELDEYINRRQESIEDIRKRLIDFLKSHGVEAQVDGRIKNLFSIYRKLKSKSYSTLQDIYDVYAFRITLPTRYGKDGRDMNDHLYSVLGLIHGNPDWRPLAHRFKDYVSVPKYNGYQSLHTAVLGLSAHYSQPTEIQIRSQRMHDAAEFGVASHWLYDNAKKRKKGAPVLGKERFSVEHLAAKDSPSRAYVEWIASLAQVQKELTTGKELMEALKTDYFSDRIFVMTPDGEVKDLPKDATPIDFAYSIHTDVGHRCQLAKVNGKVVPLSYKLQNGEMVEIVTAKEPRPKSAWLSMVKTPGAKTKIRSYFRSSDKDKIFRRGKELLNSHLTRMGKPMLDDDLSVFRYFRGKRLPVNDRIGLVEEVGNGSVLPAPLLKKVFYDREHGGTLRTQSERTVKAKRPTKKKVRRSSSGPQSIYIDGMEGLPYRLANCCKPRSGMPIIGYITRSHVVTVHRQQCKLLRSAREERILDARWEGQKNRTKYSVKLELELKNRVGLIRDIADVIASMNSNFLSFSEKDLREGNIVREAVIEVVNDDELRQLINKLERVRNVIAVRRRDS